MKSSTFVTATWTSLLFAASPASAQGFAEREWWFSNWGWGYMPFGGVMMIVFWGGLILLVVLLTRGFGGAGYREPPSPGRQSPLEILQERFAKGEIDQKEYEERRQVLSAKP
jgi:putative membrane protein